MIPDIPKLSKRKLGCNEAERVANFTESRIKREGPIQQVQEETRV